MSKFRLAHAAHSDLEDIYDYIAADNPMAAEALVESLGVLLCEGQRFGHVAVCNIGVEWL